MTERKRQNEIFVPQVHSSNGWAEQKPGAIDSTRVCFMGGWESRTWAIFGCYLRCKELELQWSSQDSNEFGMLVSQNINLLCHNMCPSLFKNNS